MNPSHTSPNQPQSQHPKPRPIRDVQTAAPAEPAQSKKSQDKPRPPKFPQKKVMRNLKLALAVLAAGLVVWFVRSYIQTRNELKRASDPQAALQEEIKRLEKETGKFLELPDAETPTLATVEDVEKLHQQAFFKRAHNGDKVLFYPKAKRAVLYRPSTKKVIEFSPADATAR